MRFIRIISAVITMFLVVLMTGCEGAGKDTTEILYSDPKGISSGEKSNLPNTPDSSASLQPQPQNQRIGIDTSGSTVNSPSIESDTPVSTHADTSVSTYTDTPASTYAETYASTYVDTYASTYAETHDNAGSYSNDGTEEYVPYIPENYLNIYRIQLSVGDLPQGYELDEIENLDNATIASTWTYADDALDRYQSWGRIAGYEVKFNKTRDVDLNPTGVFSDIYVACSTYGSIQGAAKDFAHEPQEREGEYYDFVTELGGIRYSVDPIPDLEIGDESAAQKITYTNLIESGGIDTTKSEVIFRTGYVVCNVSITMLDEKGLEENELEYVAQNQDYLIRSALADSIR